MTGDNEGKTVVILGMHRSGTSMMASVVRELGADVGKDLLPANRANPFGYFEDVDFLALNKKILGQVENTIFPIPKIEEILDKKEEFLLAIKSLLKTKKGKFWCWKDPRTSLTVDLYLPFLENPYFIICNREPAVIAHSLKKRDKLDIKKGLEAARIYNERISSFVKRHPGQKYLFVNYEDMLQVPAKEIDRVINFLELDSERRKEAIKRVASRKEIFLSKIFYIFKKVIKKI